MGLWLGARPLVLASKSESRHAILHAAGIPHEVDPAGIDERLVEQGAAVRQACEAAELLAREKALAVSARHPGALVVGADQTLAVGERRFSKPTDRETARMQLALLRHQTHELHSAMAVARDNLVLFAHREVARLTMREFSEAFLDAYLDSVGNAATASVGGYQLEKSGIQLFERVEGDHFVILGLPLLALLQFLRREGLLLV
jgi:nucleoside triphosphate pyrophosphatase